MRDLATKLTYLNETKNQIKEALGTNDDTFRDYVSQVNYENSYLAKLMANQKTSNATGSEISITDSADMYANVLDENNNVLGGVTTQETREGYNELNLSGKINFYNGGLTTTYDTETGYMTVNGTPIWNYVCVAKFEIIDALEDGQTYTFWQEYYNNKFFIQVIVTKKDGTILYYPLHNNKISLTINKTLINSYSFAIQTNTIAITGTLVNFKNRFMYYKGTEEKPYEPYGAMPSPDYSSEIECVTGTQEISFSNNDNTNSNLHTLHLGDIELYGNDTARDTLKVDVITQNNGYKKVDKLYKYKNYEKVNLKNLTGWYTNASSNGKFRYANLKIKEIIKPPANVNFLTNIICTHYKNKTANETYLNNQGISSDGTGTLYISDLRYADTSNLSEFLAYIQANDIYLVYQLLTPTLEEITDATLIADIESFINSTETYLGGTNIDSNAWLDINYAVDKDKL